MVHRVGGIGNGIGGAFSREASATSSERSFTSAYNRATSGSAVICSRIASAWSSGNKP
jgi:hypothetical protein